MVVLAHKGAQGRNGRRAQPGATPAAVRLGCPPALYACDPSPVGHGGRTDPEAAGNLLPAPLATFAGSKDAFAPIR
jgi:hypothetical protein